MEYRSEEYEEQIAKLAELYPNLSRRELEAAEYNLRSYLELMIRIHERRHRESKEGFKPDGDIHGESPE